MESLDAVPCSTGKGDVQEVRGSMLPGTFCAAAALLVRGGNDSDTET